MCQNVAKKQLNISANISRKEHHLFCHVANIFLITSRVPLILQGTTTGFSNTRPASHVWPARCICGALVLMQSRENCYFLSNIA